MTSRAVLLIFTDFASEIRPLLAQRSRASNGCDIPHGMLPYVDHGDSSRSNKERQRKSARDHPEIQPARAGRGVGEDATRPPLPLEAGVEDRQEEAGAQAHQAPHGIPKAHQGG